MSIIGLVLGIVSLVGGIIGTTLLYSTVVGIICIVLGVLGIILSVIGRKKGQNVGAGTAGLVVSILGIIFSIIFTAACACGHAVTDPLKDQIQNLSEASEEELQAAADELVNNLADALGANTGN